MKLKSLIILLLLSATAFGQTNVPISQLPAASTLTGNELLWISQGGHSVRTTTQGVANLAGASTAGFGIVISGGMIRIDTTKIATPYWVNGQIAAIPNPTWNNVQNKPSSFPPSAHTHVLADLTQGTATSGQVPQWNGTAWVPATISGGGGGSGTVTSFGFTNSTGITGTVTNAATTPTLALALTKAAVGLSNVDNTADASKPVSGATQTALDGKQATLVSGANIKTVNGNSILGGGDIAIGGGVNHLADSVYAALGEWHVSSFGAVAIDVNNRDAAPAADSAITACMNYAKTHDSTHTHVIVFDGMYRANADPSKLINGVQHYCMFYIPLVPYNTSTNQQDKWVFKGRAAGNFDIAIPAFTGIVSMSGSGIYCSRVETSQRGACVFGYERSPYGGTFESFSYSAVEFENFQIVIKTNNGGSHFLNYMSGIDMNDMGTAYFKNLRIRTTSDYSSIPDVAAGSFGVRMPRQDNHALLHNTMIYASGFYYGVITGEHSNTDVVVSVINHTGILARGTYPVNIGHACLEGNAVNIEMEEHTQLNINTLQTEDYVSGWNASQYDIYTTATNPQNCHLSANQQITHNYGGASAPLTISNTLIDVKILSDEKGIMQIPANTWTTSSRPATMLRYGGWGINTDSNKIEYYTATGWRLLGNSYTTTSAATILADYFNRADNSSSIGNLDTPASAWQVESGTWGIVSNQAYCVSETSSGGTTFQNVYKDAGVSDFTYQVDVTKMGSFGTGSLIFRYVDANNHWHLEVDQGSITLYKKVAGTYGPPATVSPSGGTATTTNSTGTPITIKVVTSGNNITVYKNGSIIINATDTQFNTATKVGLDVISGSGFGGGVRFDNLSLH